MRRHQQLPSCNGNHFSNYHSCTSDHFPAETGTSPAPATTFLQQRPPSGPSNCQFCTTSYQPCSSSDHLPAPTATSSTPSSYQFCTSDHLSNDYQLSRPAPATRSCSNDHHPAAATVRHTLFQIYDSP